MDDLLPNHMFTFDLTSGHNYIETVKNVDHLDDMNVTAIISGLKDEETMAAAMVSESVNIPIVVCDSTTSELSNGRIYPYKTRTVASESVVGYALQRAVGYELGFTRVVIFSSVDYFSSQSLFAFLSEELAVFEVLGSYVVEPGDLDMSHDIKAAKATGALVSIILLDAETTASLLIQGKKLGFFRRGSSMFLHDMAVKTDLTHFLTSIDPSQKPGYYLEGVLGIVEDPMHYVKQSSVGQAFLHRWHNNANTLSPCSDARDNSNKTIFKNAAGKCAGLDFNEFVANDITHIYENVGNCYDAVYAVAYAFNNSLYGAKARMSTEILSIDSLIGAVNFSGVTGRVVFSSPKLISNLLYFLFSSFNRLLRRNINISRRWKTFLREIWPRRSRCRYIVYNYGLQCSSL